MLCAVVLFKMKRQRYAWVALVPTAWLLICTLTAGWQKAFSPDAKVGFLAIANKFQAMIDSGNIPSQYTESQLAQLVFNNRLDAGLTIFFMVVVVVLALFSIKTALAALKEPKPTAKETPYEPMPENVEEIVAQAKARTKVRVRGNVGIVPRVPLTLSNSRPDKVFAPYPAIFQQPVYRRY